MKITRGPLAGKRVVLSRGLFGNKLVVGLFTAKKFDLIKDVKSMKVVAEQESRDIGVLTLIVLCVSIIGILIIPLLMVGGKKKQVTLQLELAGYDDPHTIVCNKDEWKVLSRYTTL